MLWSKRMMHDWKHVLDFANQQTIVGKFGLSVPFKDGIPILIILEIPDNLKYEDLPPQFQEQLSFPLGLPTSTTCSMKPLLQWAPPAVQAQPHLLLTHSFLRVVSCGF